MVIVLLVATLAASQPNSGPWRLDCQVNDRAADDTAAGHASGNEPPTSITISLDMRDNRIASVSIDGPPLFSSTQGLQSFSATPDASGGIKVTETSPDRSSLQWHGELDDRAIRLRRGESEIRLDPDPNDADAYSGHWTYRALLDGHLRIDTGGGISCRTAALPANGSSGA